MKNLLLITIFLALQVSSSAQKIRFTDPGNEWKFRDTYLLTGGKITVNFVDYKYRTDTSTHGYTYHRLNYLGIREDTIAGKVFYRNWDPYYDTIEYLLYDYNLLVNDTVKTISGPLFGYATTFWVSKIDSTKLNGLWYKVWHFNGYQNGYEDNIFSYNTIEGLGCTSGFLYPLDPIPYAVINQLICFGSKGMYDMLSNPVDAWSNFGSFTYPFSNKGCPASLFTSLTENTKEITLYPNPIDKTSRISFLNTIHSGQLLITNAVGQTIIDLPIRNKEEMLIGDKIQTPGIYFYHLLDERTGQLFTGKFIYK